MESSINMKGEYQILDKVTVNGIEIRRLESIFTHHFVFFWFNSIERKQFEQKNLFAFVMAALKYLKHYRFFSSLIFDELYH